MCRTHARLRRCAGWRAAGDNLTLLFCRPQYPQGCGLRVVRSARHEKPEEEQILTLKPTALQASGSPAARAAVVLVLSVAGIGAAAPADEGFESVPDLSPAQILAPALTAGENFHVLDPVHGDGLMYRFVIDSRFGRYEAYGEASLALRLHEIAALTTLSKLSDARLVSAGVSGGIESEVKTATGVVTHPVATVGGIPQGIAHLFKGYGARGREVLDSAQKSSGSATAGSMRSDVDKGRQAAGQYAEQYLGVSAAERGWYKRLGVDPYTDNALLRATIRRDAKIEAAGSAGIRFAGLPAIPGIAITQRAVDAIYNEDPAVIRARTRTTLAGYGLGASEIDSWLNDPLLSPTRQVLLLGAAQSLHGVKGLGELFRHSLSLSSDAEVQVYLRSAGLLARAHGERALTAIIPGVRLPAAWHEDDTLVVCGAFEDVYWTREVADAEAQLRASLPPQPQGRGRQLWLAGRLSPRAQGALHARGWEVHAAGEIPAAPPQKR